MGGGFMSRIFVTGDKHGVYYSLHDKLNRIHATKDDVVIILGDHGTLYYTDHGEDYKRKFLASSPATFICIRGNHDRRPACPAYDFDLITVDTPAYSGQFYVDRNCPSVLYTKEFGWYRFGTKPVFVIGGAFSVDKYKRFDMQSHGYHTYLWFNDEQLFSRERNAAEQELAQLPDSAFYLMTHTCPKSHAPRDMFLPNIDQAKVDETMEKWLDTLEKKLPYEKWFCGHWHTDRTIERIRFLYEDLELFDEVGEKK